MKKSSVAKFAILLIILLIIFAIYMTKNDSAAYEEQSDDFSLHVTSAIDMGRLVSHHIPVIIDFGSDSCIPCREMAPVLAKLNKDLRGRAIIRFVDVWKYKTLADGYPVSLIPTQIFVDSEGRPYEPDGTEPVPLTAYSDGAGRHTFTYHQGQVTESDMLKILQKMGMK